MTNFVFNFLSLVRATAYPCIITLALIIPATAFSANPNAAKLAPIINLLFGEDSPSPPRFFGARPVVSTPVNQGSLFASPAGNGNSCTLALPCSIETAIAQLSAGDVLFLRGGNYIILSHLNIIAQGNQANPIIIESYPGELAVLDGQNETAADVISGNFPTGPGLWAHANSAYITIRKLEVKNMSEAGIALAGERAIVEGCHVYNNHYNGIHIIDGAVGYNVPYVKGYNIVRDNFVYDNSDIGLNTAPYNNGGNSDGISVSSSKFNQITHNTVYGNSDDGIDTWRSNDSLIRYNRVYQNGIAPGNGNGIKFGSSTDNVTGLRARVEYNLSYNNRSRGFNSNSGIGVIIRYNTAFDNGTVGFKTTDDTVVEYNIATNPNGDPLTDIRAGHANNSWQQAGPVNFISTAANSANFLKPVIGSGVENMGAYSH